MEHQKAHFQALFLIDIHLNRNGDSNLISKYNRVISLSVFRILKTLYNYGANQKILSSENPLSWCYKFYSSNSGKARLRKACLTDFKLRNFEEFERQFDEKLEIENPLPQTVRSSQESSGQNTSVKSTRNKTKCHAESLKDALTEVVTDILWECDQSSPVKYKKHSKHMLQSKERSLQRPRRNFVFLFSQVPCNPDSLRKFAGKRVIDSEVLVDSFMTPSLHTTFCENAHLSLIWVDTSCLNDLHQSSGSDPESLQIVESSVASLDGAVLSVDSIVSTSGPWSCGRFKSCPSIQDKLGISGDVGKISLAAILSTTTVLVHYFQPQAQKRCRSVQGSLTLCHAENSKSIELFLELIPVTVNCSFQSDQRNDDRSSEVLPVIACQIEKPRFSVIAGLTRRSALSLLTQPRTSYIAHDTQTQLSASHSVTLADLMTEMTNCGQILVLQVKEGDCVLPGLALLDVNTHDSACISLLSVGSSLQVEKTVFGKLLSATSACLNSNELKAPQLSAKDCDVSDTKKTNVSHSSRERAAKIDLHCDRIKNRCNQDESNRRKLCGAPLSCYKPQVVNPWHIAGSTKGLFAVIGKLTERIDQLNFLTLPEKQILKNVQQLYRKCNRPCILQKTNPQTVEESKPCGLVSTSGVAQPKVTLCKQKSGLFRGELMVKRSQAAVKEDLKAETTRKVEEEDVQKDKSRSSLDIPAMEFESEESVGLYLQGLYLGLVERGSGLEFGVQTMVTVSLHFIKQSGSEQPEKSLMDLFNAYVLLSMTALRDKYKDKTSSEDKNNKITEFQLQILLRLELECVVLDTPSSHTEQVVNEVVALLRSLSFITDPGFVPSFLNKDLLTSYRSTLPKLLVNIYDELMQPLPETLAGFGSPESCLSVSLVNQSAVSSQIGDSVLSMSPPASDKSDVLLSSQSSRNLRSRKLSHHPSIDYGTKKQIVVMKPLANKKVKHSSHSKRSKKSKETDKRKSEVARARRSLFDKEKPKLERSQSTSVVEHIKRTPRKILSTLFKSPQSSKSPRLQKKVAETPSHKQRCRGVWRNQGATQTTADSLADIQVVGESPLKTAAGILTKFSPARSKHAVNMVRRSFYSTQSKGRSRNLTKFLDLAHKIGGSLRLSAGSGCAETSSPNNSSFLFSQLMGSPPARDNTWTSSRGESEHVQAVDDSPFKNTRSKTPTKSITRMLSFESPHDKRSSQLYGNSVNKTQKTPSPVKTLCHRRALRSSPWKPGPESSANSVIHNSFSPVRMSSSHNQSHTTPHKSFSVDQKHQKSPAEKRQLEANYFCSAVHTKASRVESNSSETPRKYLQSPRRRSVGTFFTRLDSSHDCSSPSRCANSSQNTPEISSAHKQKNPSSAWSSLQSTPRKCGDSRAEVLKSPQTPPSVRKSCLISPLNKSPFRATPEKRVHFGISAISSVSDQHVHQTYSLNKDPSQAQKCNVFKSHVDVSELNGDDSKVTITCEAISSGGNSGAGGSLRTPSPCGKQNVKTPDSLDKWPRRKRRWVSPSGSMSNAVHTTKELATGRLHLQANNSKGFIPACERLEADVQKTLSTRSRKRSRHESPESPRKRQRISITNPQQHSHIICDTSIEDYDNSFEVDTSIAGDVSSVNDSVFLSDSTVTVDTLSCQHSESSMVFHPRELYKMSTSGFRSMPSDERERTSSPVLNSSPHSRFTQSPSNSEVENSKTCPRSVSNGSQGFECSVQSDQYTGDNAVSSSPSFKGKGSLSCDKRDNTSLTCEISPQQQVKFSPSVSAKSLIHLMHSPLIQTTCFSASTSGSDRLRSPPSGRKKSRKMLNLQN